MRLRAAGSAIAISIGILAARSDCRRHSRNGCACGEFCSGSCAGSESAARRVDINPYDRDVEITAPLQFNRRVLGELPVLLTRDDRFVIGTEGFMALIGPLLTPEARAELAALLGDKPRFLPDDVAESGITLEYDPEQLAVLVLTIAPEKRSVEILYQHRSPEEAGDPPVPFSAFLNCQHDGFAAVTNRRYRKAGIVPERRCSIQ